MSEQAAVSPARAVFRHSVMTLGSRMGIVLINIPTSILVARLLGTEGQGLYASAIIFPTMFAFIGLFGVDAAHTFMLSRRSATLGQINAQSVRVAAVLSLAVTAAYVVFTRFYGQAQGAELAGVLSMAAAVIPVLLVKYLSVALLLGLGRIKWFNAANIVQAATLLGLMCLNLFVFHGGVRGALISYMVSEVTVSLIAFRVAALEAGGSPLFERPPAGLLKRSMVYGLQGHVGNVLTQFTYRFDMFLVLTFAGLGAQGLYSIAVILAEKLSHIPQSVQVVLFPKLSSLSAEEANALTPRVLRSALFLTAVAGIVLFLVSRPLLLLFYGTAYLPALRSFQILLPGIVALSIAKILAGDFSGRDRRVFHTVATAAGFAVNLALCLRWIPRYGLEGAAWASTAAYSIQSVLALIFFKRLSGNGFAESLIIRREDVRLFRAAVFRRLGKRWRSGS
jgi:O-antigen/teichoic acid export membrane protein